MKHTPAAWIIRVLAAVLALSLLAGCDNSGYGMADPYVITGTVSNSGGSVEGKVFARTSKRYDLYEAAIDAETGNYTLSITQPDPPYILWAEIDGSRDLYSYTAGNRNTGEKDDIPDQTVNINPITDMIMSLAYNEDTNERFSREPSKILPKKTDAEYHQSEFEKMFEKTFTSVCLKDGFDLIHGDFRGDVATLLGSLSSVYVSTEDERSVSLIGGTQAYYAYDLEIKEKTFDVSPDQAEQLLFIQTGLARPVCKP